ncbi:hypothetical protein PILCRDRAFT_87893 [Piloderma croceum F 1598]|uniref:Uncharacterized protein n=1 Tax=Piloderma croceum (strain F 1598) TaxID=765440 RepID=A0A0C3FWQ4_PILCF|nr:hypothetical protein PILCRDRAFT_87893 [Piloderma croceum F 1598]
MPKGDKNPPDEKPEMLLVCTCNLPFQQLLASFLDFYLLRETNVRNRKLDGSPEHFTSPYSHYPYTAILLTRNFNDAVSWPSGNQRTAGTAIIWNTDHHQYTSNPKYFTRTTTLLQIKYNMQSFENPGERDENSYN